MSNTDAASTAGMQQELAQEFSASDRRLNDAYGKLIAAADPTRAGLLRALQRAWMPYRDALAALEADDARGGTESGVMAGAARDAETERQAAYLEAKANDKAG